MSGLSRESLDVSQSQPSETSWLLEEPLFFEDDDEGDLLPEERSPCSSDLEERPSELSISSALADEESPQAKNVPLSAAIRAQTKIFPANFM